MFVSLAMYNPFAEKHLFNNDGPQETEFERSRNWRNVELHPMWDWRKLS